MEVAVCGECNAVESRGDKHQPWCSQAEKPEPGMPKFQDDLASYTRPVPKVIYIAGPYGDTGGYVAIDRNIAAARAVAIWLVNNQIGFICPHMNSAHFEEITPLVPTEFWYAMDLKLMECADAIYLMEGWEHSNGCRKELDYWQRNYSWRPVFTWTNSNELIKWSQRPRYTSEEQAIDERNQDGRHPIG